MQFLVTSTYLCFSFELSPDVRYRCRKKRASSPACVLLYSSVWMSGSEDWWALMALVIGRWGRKVIPGRAEAQRDLFSAPVWPPGLEVQASVSYSEAHLLCISQESVLWPLAGCCVSGVVEVLVWLISFCETECFCNIMYPLAHPFMVLRRWSMLISHNRLKICSYFPECGDGRFCWLQHCQLSKNVFAGFP